MKKLLDKRFREIRKLIPLSGLEGNAAILNDGRVFNGFELVSEEMERRDANGFEALNNFLCQLLRSFPAGSVIHKLDFYFHDPFKGDLHDQAYFRRKTHAHFYDRPILKHRSYLLLSIGKSSQMKSSPVNNVFSLGIPKNVLAGVEDRITKVRRLGIELADSLNAIGIGCKPMDKESIQQLYYRYFNLSFTEKPTAYNRQIFRHPAGMSLGEKHVKVLSLNEAGNHIAHSLEHQGVAQPFVNPLTHQLDFPHILSTAICIQDQEKELKAMDLEKKLSNTIGTFGGQAHQIKAEEIDHFTAEVRVSNQQIVATHLNVILWDADQEILSQRINQTIAAFRQMGGAEALVENLDTTSLFVANAPGNAFQSYRWLRRLTAEQASAFMHFTTTYRSDQDGEYLCDRLGNPLLVRLFNADLNNQNAIVVGPSGSGKSFTVGSFIIQRFEQQYRQIIIDNGGTYLNVVTALGGKYFEYDPANPLSFNPFFCEKKRDQYELTGDKLSFLVALLAVIWKGNEGDRLSKAEQSLLSNLIPVYYRETEVLPSFKGFFEWFQAYDENHQNDKGYQRDCENVNVGELFLVMKPFVYGEYKAVLNSDESIDLSEYPLIAFDMAKVKSNMMLYPIIALLITELALEQIRKFPKERKFIYMDEAWSMLSDSMGGFVEHMFRTIRKNNGSMSIITQGVSEIVESSVGNAILANASTQIILNHTDKKQIDRLGEVFGFTRHQLDLIRSIQVFKDRREIFVKQGEHARVYMLETSPEMAITLSSKPAERNYLNQLIEEKGNVTYAIEQYVEDKLEGMTYG